jgi:hypothetical protein
MEPKPIFARIETDETEAQAQASSKAAKSAKKAQSKDRVEA